VWAMTGVCWVTLVLSYLLTNPDKNVNWVFRLGASQPPVSPIVYLLGMMAAMPLMVYHPTHLLLRRLSRQRGST
jgi:hypothetical protein